MSKNYLWAEGMRVLPADLSERSCTIHIGVGYAQKSGMWLHLNNRHYRDLRDYRKKGPRPEAQPEIMSQDVV
jgi:hypothetical protein